jgi:uncharacterized repeat protein (TIGR01451 family)
MRTLPITLALVAALLALAGQGTAATTPSSDLAVRASDSPDPVAVGSTLGYSIEVRNQGPDAATDVRLTIGLPRGADLLSASPSAGSCGPVKSGRVTCTLGTLPAPTLDYSGPPSVAVSLIPRRTGVNTATFTIDGHEKDPVGSNDKATVTTLVTGPPPTCSGRAATIVGTPGDDDLGGTPGPDVIVALGGDDTVASSLGRDVVCAGAGLDHVFAGPAADRVYGGGGGDRVSGGGGPDLLKGDAGQDVLLGKGGADRLRGGSGRDRCRGGAGADTIRGCER